METSARKNIKDFFIILIGTIALSTALNVFFVPSKISSGGVSSIGTVLYYIFKVPLSVTNLFFNAILFAFGYRYLGKSSLLKTVVGILLLSVFLGITELIPTYTDDVLIATLAGGVLSGFGIGIIVRTEGSTGGSDFAGLILNRFLPHISVPVIIFGIDTIITIIAGLVFKSVTITFYSAIALLVSAKVSDAVLYFGDVAKSVYIISSKSEEISKKVMGIFERGATGIYCRGMYSNSDSLMLYCVVSPRELPKFISTVRKIDSNAFVVISDAKEVLGEGFKTEAIYDKI